MLAGHLQIPFLVGGLGTAADLRREVSTMSTELIIFIVVLFILFGGGGFYWSRRG